jgi:hypothetical protein
MAKYCSEGCHAVCDFCKYYIDDSETEGFNPDEFEGEGFCKAKNTRTDAGSFCDDDFECFLIE